MQRYWYSPWYCPRDCFCWLPIFANIQLPSPLYCLIFTPDACYALERLADHQGRVAIVDACRPLEHGADFRPKPIVQEDLHARAAYTTARDLDRHPEKQKREFENGLPSRCFTTKPQKTSREE